jgi:hypothetical protein
MTVVQRLLAQARLEDSPKVLAHARAEAAAGDESWEEWLAEYERGDALMLRLELAIDLDDGARLSGSSSGLFVERHAHVPKVEQQVAEQASGDFTTLAEQLCSHGFQLDAYELGDMYIHVELDDEVRARMAQV